MNLKNISLENVRIQSTKGLCNTFEITSQQQLRISERVPDVDHPLPGIGCRSYRIPSG
jgi:hypothetical protein